MCQSAKHLVAYGPTPRLNLFIYRALQAGRSSASPGPIRFSVSWSARKNGWMLHRRYAAHFLIEGVEKPTDIRSPSLLCCTWP